MISLFTGFCTAEPFLFCCKTGKIPEIEKIGSAVQQPVKSYVMTQNIIWAVKIFRIENGPKSIQQNHTFYNYYEPLKGNL